MTTSTGLKNGILKPDDDNYLFHVMIDTMTGLLLITLNILILFSFLNIQTMEIFTMNPHLHDG